MVKKSLLSAILCAMSLVACNENQDADKQGAFRFSAMCYDYSGGSAMMAAGDSAGIFAGAPLSVLNRKGMMESSGYLVFSPYIQIIEGSADTSKVCVYSPYSSGLSASQPIFSVREDQRDSAAFRVSCLRTASAKLLSGDNSKATKLLLHPVMAQLSVRITNMTSSPINSVKVKNMKGSVLLNTENGTISATGDKSDFLAYADPDSAGIYKLYLAPQESSIVVSASLQNGDEYDFTMTAALESGQFTTNAASPFVIESKIGPVKPEDFTSITIPGIYRLTSEVLSPVLIYSAGKDQYASSSANASRQFRLQNLSGGWMYRISVAPDPLAEGASVSIDAEAVNCAALSSGTYAGTVVKTSDTLAWITCTDADLAFIIKTD